MARVKPLWTVLSGSLGQSGHNRSLKVVADTEAEAVSAYREYCHDAHGEATVERTGSVVVPESSTDPGLDNTGEVVRSVWIEGGEPQAKPADTEDPVWMT